HISVLVTGRHDRVLFRDSAHAYRRRRRQRRLVLLARPRPLRRAAVADAATGTHNSLYRRYRSADGSAYADAYCSAVSFRRRLADRESRVARCLYRTGLCRLLARVNTRRAPRVLDCRPVGLWLYR